MKFFRFPRDTELAIKWKRKLGFDGNKPVSGMICIDHFNKSDLKLITRGNLQRNVLKVGAVPNVSSEQSQHSSHNLPIQSTSSDDHHELLKDANIQISNLTRALTEQKQSYENRIHSLSIQNQDLKKKLANSRSKTYRLTQTKSELLTKITQLKEQSILSEKFTNALEV